MKMTELRKKLLKLALTLFVFGLVLFGLTYLFYHHITPTGFCTEKQMAPGKPMITNMIGLGGVVITAGAIISALAAIIVAEKEKD